MSDTENSGEQIQKTPLDEVVIDDDDASNILEFFAHFNISVPDYLKLSVDSFSAAIAEPEEKQDKLLILQLQNDIRVNLCRTFIEHDTPIFKDEIFNVVVENSKIISFESFFRSQLETACSEEPVKV